MKKTRRMLSLVLAVLFAFSSMPVVYTGTAAADAVTYALEETGTAENPTKPVEASGSFAYKDLVKITIELFNTDYTFYQTKDEEYFTLTQSFLLQKVNADDIKVKFESVGYWDKKTSDMSDPTSTKLEWRGNEDDGLWEVPGVKDNRTDLFLANHRVSETWTPTTPAAQAATIMPFELSSSAKYAWDFNLVFKGNIDDQTGEHDANFYQQLKWRWDANDNSDFAKVDVRLQTRIKFLDAREFVNELAKLESIVANPDEYTQAYVSSAQAILNEIPDDLKTLSVAYEQSVIDEYTERMKELSLNSADYTEYNKLYSSLISITNEKGAFTANSFATFQTEIARVNGSLSKSLDKTKQATVDSATQALKDAFSKLVATDLSEDVDSTCDWTSRDKGYGRIDAQIDRTSFKFMQVRDYQKFQFDQSFYIRRYGGNNSSRFWGLYFEENYPTCGSSSCAGDKNLSNGTTQFLNMMDQGMLTSVTAKDENDSTITAKEFNQWVWDGTVKNAGDSIVSNGLLSHGFKLAKGGFAGTGEYLAYAADSSPVFYGRVAGDYGEIDLTYVYRLGYMYDSSDFAWTKEEFYHWHIPTTIEVTDVRRLIEKLSEAEEFIENAEDYSDAYIACLKAATTGIPVEMTRGVEYYTQEEVDTLFNQVDSVLTAGEEGVKAFADYTEYAELLEKLMAVENQSRYTEDSFEIFEKEVYQINKNLDKNLPANEQAKVDAAIDSLRKAYAKLEFYEVGNDNNYGSNALPDYLGNSGLEFRVSNTEYNFMQTYDGQKFALETELYLESTNDNYDSYICGLQYSMVKAGDSTCADRGENADAGCHNLENNVVSSTGLYTNNFLDSVVEGVEKAAKDANGNYILASDGTGTIGQNTTWVFDEDRSVGSSFIENGKIKYESLISTAPHYATSEVLCVGFDGGASGDAKGFEAVYSWRLGWSYREKHVLDNIINLSSTTYRHAHIPVTVRITDARALYSIYDEIDDILNGRSDVTYTLETLRNLNEAFEKTPEDMVYGDNYYTQDTVNAEYARLKAAFDQLESGADYTEYFETYIEAKEIIDSDNQDSRGNKLYDEDAYNTFVENVTNIDSNLPKKLENTKENQETIDAATQKLLDELKTLEETKRADYSNLNDAMTEAEKILNAPEGTYTDKTLEEVQKAYDDANNLPGDLSQSEQGQIDSARDALEDAIADKEYKADYSEYNKAYDKVQYIIDNPGKYTEETVKAAEQVMGTAGAIDKDLPDTAANRVIIKNATDELNNMLKNVVETADYTKFNEAYKKVEEIANDTTGKYTDETIQAAKDALVEADKLEKELPNNHENQAKVDKATAKLEEMIKGAVENADYTDYNKAKDEADKLVNDDGNGNPIYDEEIFQQYKEAVEKLDSELEKDLTKEEQEIVDKATDDLKDLRTELDASAKDPDRIVIDPETSVDDKTVQEIVDEVINDVTENQGYSNDEIIVEFKDYTGKELAGEEFVGTGSTMRVILKSTGKLLEYKLFIVYGDVDGDGDVDEDDYQKSMNVGLKKESYSEEHNYFFIANDVIEDGVIDVLDCATIRRYM